MSDVKILFSSREIRYSIQAAENAAPIPGREEPDIGDAGIAMGERTPHTTTPPPPVRGLIVRSLEIPDRGSTPPAPENPDTGSPTADLPYPLRERSGQIRSSIYRKDPLWGAEQGHISGWNAARGQQGYGMLY